MSRLLKHDLAEVDGIEARQRSRALRFLPTVSAMPRPASDLDALAVPSAATSAARKASEKEKLPSSATGASERRWRASHHPQPESK